MKKTAQQSASTQQFTEIKDIRDNVVFLSGNNACLIIKVMSVNFALLSREEQDTKVFAYAALLNSLSFPIQIVVISQQVEISPYLESLDHEAKKTTNKKLADNILLYKNFVTDLVKMTTVLDKQFYVVIPYSPLEGGIKNSGAITGVKEQMSDDFVAQVQAALETKADSLLSQLDRLSLKAKLLEHDDLIRLFYDIYNPTSPLPVQGASGDLLQMLLKGGTK